MSSPAGDGSLRIAVLFSGGASGFRYLVEHDSGYGAAYEVAVGVTSTPDAPGIGAFREAGVPVVVNDIEAYYARHDAPRRDLDVRAAYDARTRGVLDEFEPDLVVLSGYMWILTEAVIGAYPTVNVHPADLTILDEDGHRVYVGFDPVTDAIRSGEPDTRSVVHYVTPEIDAGPILVRSKPFPVHTPLVEGLEAYDGLGGLAKYAAAHQEWMKWEGDGPAIAMALHLVAAGRVESVGSRVAIDGTPGFYDLGTNSVVRVDET